MVLPLRIQNRNESKKSFYLARHPEEGVLLITFKSPCLDISRLQNLINRLANRPMLKIRRILFDLSTVEEFQGPWCSHFAAIALLAEKFRGKIDIRVTGLKGQPQAMALAFNRSSVIQCLLTSN